MENVTLACSLYANPDKEAFYEKFGFERCGTMPHAFKLKDGTYRDEIMMVKML